MHMLMAAFAAGALGLAAAGAPGFVDDVREDGGPPEWVEDVKEDGGPPEWVEDLEDDDGPPEWVEDQRAEPSERSDR